MNNRFTNISWNSFKALIQNLSKKNPLQNKGLNVIDVNDFIFCPHELLGLNLHFVD
ncbi:hypothetical protein M2372_001144 [Chryseobacterium sp. BIGb0232]|nr:hypothetical protein [Chryseobacterium sp. BIGb0232]ROS19433.1 hypothetical protein EDF65_0119 [Chryseobacterium nakagawai]